ncbi:MAG TPA: phospho-N-acetylmuramoyl-pentapeptide-transferase, partial [Chloroflexi bacterium]|nr:phospho-N-acetylmuramoyl-pentapeptide-transferase [Chloroflexota bacterium]
MPTYAIELLRAIEDHVVHNSLLPLDPLDNLAISLALAGVAFMLSVAIGRPCIDFLRARGIGKQIRIEGPEGHMTKTGTPTMGGVIFISTVVILTIVFNLIGRLSMLLPLGVLIGTAILGGIDDRLNLVGGQRTGLTARFKMIWLLLFAGIGALVLYYPLGLHSIYVPFIGRYEIGLFYIPIAILVISGTANAVNLTDG